MMYNRFSLNIILRSCLLLMSCLLFAFLYLETNRFFTILFIGGLIVVQIISLIYFQNSTNRELARFLLYVQECDTSMVFNSEKIEETFKGIHHSFKKINAEIQKIKIDREKKVHLLNNVVSHLKIPFMAYNSKGEILLINKAVEQLFLVDQPKRLGDIQPDNKGLHEFFSQLSSNYQGVFNYRERNNDISPLLVRSSDFTLAGDKIQLLTFQNIKTQLDGNEMESWQKLMRVLAHEISNSLAPITMLGGNIRQRLTQNIDQSSIEHKIPDNIIKDVVRSAELIEQRGNRLIEFIDSYKSYARLPKPSLSKVFVKDLFIQIEQFFQDQFNTDKIEFISRSIPNAQLFVDMSLIEQVLINLIQNAIQAMQTREDKKIELIHSRSEKNDLIQIIDNGIGITDEIKDKIFIPFYTTKERGTGIGLSLSKNIMHMHNGSISIYSEPHIKTIITLKF